MNANTPNPVRFEFATTTRIIFGKGSLRELGTVARQMGFRALVVTGRNVDRVRPAFEQLQAQGVGTVAFSVASEPTLQTIGTGLDHARRERCDLVVACGGGSAIDTGKAIAALMTNGGELLDYLEVIGRAQPLQQPSAPVIAIPTTAGTGCEVTRNAVIASPEHRFKVSLRSPFLLPRVAIVDPELACSLPRDITASTGLDALTQLIEPFVSARANPLTDGLCREGISRVARSLRRVCDEPADFAAREDMALASLFSGMALANAGLGAVHGFAAPLGGMFPAPHGAVCAALLPTVMEMNVRALAERMPESPALRRYDEVARLLTGDAQATASDGLGWMMALCRDLSIQPLRTYGITQEDIPLLVEKAAQASSMKANPIALTEEELAEVVGQSW